MNQRVLIEKNYLRIPIRKDAVEKNVWLYQELTAVLQFQAGLFVDYGSGAPDFYAELPVERWKGSVLTLVHEEDRPVPRMEHVFRHWVRYCQIRFLKTGIQRYTGLDKSTGLWYYFSMGMNSEFLSRII